MTPRHIRFIASLCLIVTFGSLLIPTARAQALTGSKVDDLPSLQAFTGQIITGQAGELVGVYIPNILAAQITTQPEGNAEFVTPWPNYMTQFSAASKFGSTGLLAHNYLAGQHFSKLTENQTFHLIHGNGTTTEFVVTDVLHYQALQPNSASGAFKDLVTGETLTASELFEEVYDKPGMVVFQTCISANGDAAWGRLFIIAEPYSQ